MYDELKRTENDNPTIGIVLCEEKDRAEVKFSVLNDNEQLFATKYKLYIPTEEELIREITQTRALMSATKGKNELRGTDETSAPATRRRLMTIRHCDCEAGSNPEDR
jgi:hypothetical protein